MKVGMRKPSLKKSIKARTTGRVKRTLKKSVNPLYGKKGMGYVKDPKRAIKNKIYHKVTIDPLDSIKHTRKPRDSSRYDPDITHVSKVKPQGLNRDMLIILFSLLSCIGFIYFIVKEVKSDEFHPIWLLIAIVSIIIVMILRKKNET